jgi:hypothetical protein
MRLQNCRRPILRGLELPERNSGNGESFWVVSVLHEFTGKLWNSSESRLVRRFENSLVPFVHRGMILLALFVCQCRSCGARDGRRRHALIRTANTVLPVSNNSHYARRHYLICGGHGLVFALSSPRHSRPLRPPFLGWAFCSDTPVYPGLLIKAILRQS